jgi:tetratricopeptide (TPR) repeat protein
VSSSLALKSAILEAVIRQLIISIGLLLGSSLAQSLEVSPWLPAADGRTTLSGQGFEATSTVALSFTEPRPMLPDGKAVPASVQANTQGGFRLELKVSGSRLSVTAKSGARSASLVRTPPQLEFVADGSSIVAKEAGNGKITQRFYLSGLVKTLEPTTLGYRATVQTTSGVEEVFLLENGKILERVVFAPSPVLLETLNRGWREKVIGDPIVFWRGRVALDSTNPLLQVQLGLALQKNSQSEAAKLAFSQALDVSVPFYVCLRLAQELEQAQQPDLADLALAKARIKYAEGGYDPGFAVSKAVLAAWGDPLLTATMLFKSNNPKRAEAWLAYLRDTTPHFPGAGTVFLEYAAWLDAQNRAGEARQIRELMTDLDKGSVFRFGDAGLIRLSAFALAGAVVALVSFLLLQFVLLLKYWSQQTKDLVPFGGRFGAIGRAPLARLRHSLPAYYTFTEKLVLLVLLLACVVGIGVWQYSAQADKWLRQSFLTQGTAGGASYFQALNNVPQPSADYLRGLGLQLSNDLDGAIGAYRSSGNLAGAANNLGVILASRGDKAGSEREFQRAAGLGSRVANQNLGSSILGYRAAFHAAYRKGSAMLEVPNAEELVVLRFGTLEQEFRRMVQDPWSYWLALSFSLPLWGHQALGALVLATILLSLLWLLVPRVASANNAPRSILYHLGAILIPGSGLADEVWGIILLPPSVALGALIVIQLYQLPFAESILQGSSILGLSNLPPLLDLQSNWQYLLIALAAIYAINILAWILETLALRRRKVP